MRESGCQPESGAGFPMPATPRRATREAFRAGLQGFVPANSSVRYAMAMKRLGGAGRRERRYRAGARTGGGSSTVAGAHLGFHHHARRTDGHLVFSRSRTIGKAAIRPIDTIPPFIRLPQGER